MSEISITYDLLFDILKIEKSREDLQKLEDKFYLDVVDYLNSKDSVISNPNTPIRERELTRIQLGNVKKLLLELYDRREKKIISLAIYKVKTGDGIIHTESLLKEERILFDLLYLQLSKYRRDLLDNVLEGKIPVIGSYNINSDSNTVTKVVASESNDDLSTLKSVRFTKPVPKFLGSELEIYGPYEENDIASIPTKIALILIKKDHAEEMRF